MRELLTGQQKQRDEQRQVKIDQIKDDKARQDLTLRMASDDKNATDQLDRLKEKQQAEINKQTNKEVNQQGNPVLDFMNLSGRTPKEIHDKVAQRLKPMHEREQATLVQGTHDMMRGSIDKEIQKHIEREQSREHQRQEQIRNRPPNRCSRRRPRKNPPSMLLPKRMTAVMTNPHGGRLWKNVQTRIGNGDQVTQIGSRLGLVDRRLCFFIERKR